MRVRKQARIKRSACARCRRLTPEYDIIQYPQGGRYRPLCNDCCNAEVAIAEGIENFERIDFQPMTLVDGADIAHEFHFRTRLIGTEVALDALEIRNGQADGYRFQIIGDATEDRFALLGRLLAKMRRSLARTHLTGGPYGLEIADFLVRGSIEFDSYAEGQPQLLIDGRRISWEHFGRMLMTFEGWQFRLEIKDPSDEV